MIRINENITRQQAKLTVLIEKINLDENENLITLTVGKLLSRYLLQPAPEQVFLNSSRPVKKHETHVWLKQGHQILQRGARKKVP